MVLLVSPDMKIHRGPKIFFFFKIFFQIFQIFFYKILVQIDTVNGRKASAHCRLVGIASAHWTERPQISAT